MKTIPELKKGDMVNVNGEIHTVISNKESAGGAQGEMVLELGRLGDRNPTPLLRMTYHIENPLSLRLEGLDKKTGNWKVQKLVKFGF